MAPPPGTLRVGRYLLTLVALTTVLYAIVFFGDRHTPKLGLDLVGGTQVIFQAKTPNGGTPSKSSMEQAQHIIQERVNGTGVTEATVVIQGDDQLVVSIPGGTGKDVSRLGDAAVLNMRGLVAPAVGIACGKLTPAPSATGTTAPTGSGSSTAPGSSGASAGSGTAASTTAASPPRSSSGATPQDARERPLAAPSTSVTPAPATSSPATTSAAGSTSSAAPSGSGSSTAAAATVKCVADPMGALKKSDPSLTIPLTDKAFEALPQAKQTEILKALTTFDCAAGSDEPDVKTSYFVACDSTGTIAYLLGTVIVPGNQIDSASAQAPNGQSSLKWAVGLNFKSTGERDWARYTAAHNIGDSSGTTNADPSTCSSSTYACANFVGFTLDGRVISIPVNESAINGGTTQIQGSFDDTSANQLADQLRFGALPLSFTSQQAQTVSATLGTSQLEAGLLAGGIGLILVVIYSLFYYRALGLVTIASLLVSGALTYAMLVLLGTQIGFTLSLAGIAGFIVAVGITADSFVVFFERIKDEVHGGRSVRVAVPRAWVRARRTILSADTVSFLAAAILYYFAAGDVKGFAFTLGLSTILDLVVVFLFTHPIVSLLSRSRTFGSSRFTGLDSVRVGPVLADPQPADRARSRRKGDGRADAAKPAAEKRSAVAVLDKDPDPANGADEAVDSEGITADGVTEPVEADTEASAEPGATADETRRRSTPAPGSAAERAAARRARMRGRQDDTNGNGDGAR